MELKNFLLQKPSEMPNNANVTVIVNSTQAEAEILTLQKVLTMTKMLVPSPRTNQKRSLVASFPAPYHNKVC